jgi:N-acetyl-anhydromuramyl-L-alanine amidase AmpD
MTITNMYITNNRPYEKRERTTKIAVHYVANKGSSAIANRNYFNTTKTAVSSNYLIGLEGEIICCIPPDEISWCTNSANAYAPSIEACHPDSTGKFNTKTYKSLVELTAFLCKRYNLTEKDVIRHYDVTHKVCPKSFVPANKGGTDDNNNTAWKKFIADVKLAIEGKDFSKTTTTTNTSVKKKMYRVRKSWEDIESQIGAFSNLTNAKAACKIGYSVYDENGVCVYTKADPFTISSAPNIFYTVYIPNSWLPAVKNFNNTSEDGYAGIKKNVIHGLAVKSSKGTLKYRVHVKGGKWLNWVSKYNTTNWSTGCAGIKGQTIDAIQMKLEGVTGYEVKYRVSTVNSDSYLPWVIGTDDYAGIMGMNIDCIQAEIVKK